MIRAFCKSTRFPAFLCTKWGRESVGEWGESKKKKMVGRGRHTYAPPLSCVFTRFRREWVRVSKKKKACVEGGTYLCTVDVPCTCALAFSRVPLHCFVLWMKWSRWVVERVRQKKDRG